MSKILKNIIIFILFSIAIMGCKSEENKDVKNDITIDLLNYNWNGWSIAYSGYREGQDPRTKIFPTQEQVLEDLRILEKNWRVIRTYGADQHLVDVLEVISKEKISLKVLLGIWLDGAKKYEQENRDQINLGIELANKYKDIVIAINVGNESQVFWSNHKMPQKELIDAIKEVQQKTTVPVTTADTWDYWTNLKESQEVIDVVDFVAAHIYPIWGGIDIENAMDFTKHIYDSLKTSIPNKKIVITEAGWASYTEGEQHAPKAGDEVKQKEYFFDLMKWADENKIVVFNFSAFDESWKGTGTEGHWGLFSEKRKAKLVMHEKYPELKTDEPTSPKYK